jgi:Ca2+-binding EF-hand superfamily protein
VDRIYLLKHIVIDSTGQISLAELFNNFSKIIEHPIASPILAFYNVAYIIEKRLKLSTLEFIYKNRLTLEQELNINDFYLKISDCLKIDDITSIIVFKGLDCLKRGKIKVEDFVVVINSYRSDSALTPNESKTVNNFNNSFQNLKSDIDYLKEQLSLNSVTVDEIYDKAKKNDMTSISNALRALLSKADMTRVENVLMFIKNDEGKIQKNDLQRILLQDNIDNKFIYDFSKNKSTKSNKFGLNDAQIYWIQKLINLLDSISVTPLMAFEAAVEKNKNDVINLDTYKKKLNILISPGKVTASELNFIADSLDVFNNRTLLQQDYLDILNIAETYQANTMNLFSASAYIKDSKNSFKNPLCDTFTDANNKLPVRGNNNVIKNLREDFNKTNFSLKTMDGTNTNLKESLDKSAFVKTNNFINNANDNDFLKDLDVFEHGEWGLIELLEDTKITTKNSLPSYDLFGVLVNKYTPTIPKNKLFGVLKLIDTNQDGFITNYDLMSFLFGHLKHSSTKLALKEIARKIEFEENLSTEDFFSRKYMQPSQIFNFVNFTQFFIKNFEIDPPIVKKLFDEMKQILNGKENITVADVIDIINEYREASSMATRKKEFNSISILDKKFYEEEMKAFVKHLHKGFGSIDKNANLLKENLLHFLQLTNTLNLHNFRENFIKPLSMELPLGIATFQLLKSFSNKDESIITKDDLLNLVYSYIDTSVTKMDPEIIVNNIETNSMPVKSCFESLGYNQHGVPIYDIVRVMENCYPRFHRSIIVSFAKSIDRLSVGIVSYKDICDTLYTYSKKDNVSPLLMIKYVSYLIDNKGVTCEDLIKELKAKKIQSANLHLADRNGHLDYFMDRLSFKQEQCDGLYMFLSDDCPLNGYIVEKLIKLVELNRLCNPNVVFDNSENINIASANENEVKELLRALNLVKRFSEVFDNIPISQANIAISEIFKTFVVTYKAELKKQIFSKFLKNHLDENKQGYVHYGTFNNTFYLFLDDYNPSIKLHSRYLANKLFTEYKGKWGDYLKFKGLMNNKYITYQKFIELYKQDECCNDNYIAHTLFETIKDKSGKFANQMLMQNFIDYIVGFITSNGSEDACIDDLNDVELSESVNEIISAKEMEGKLVRELFDNINLRQVNNFGKINSEYLNGVLKERYGFTERELKILNRHFCAIYTLFDLIKLLEYLLSNGNRNNQISKEGLTKKMSAKIPKNTLVNDFCNKFNIQIHNTIGLVELCNFLKPIFATSHFENFYIFTYLIKSENNVIKDEFKITFDYFLQEFNLYPCFKIIPKEIKIDGNTMLVLKKFCDYLEKQPSKIDIFRKFDTNKNGILSRDEFLNLLRSCKDLSLNDSQKILVLNYADKNNDDNINYVEFLCLLNDLKNYQPEQQAPSKPKSTMSNNNVKTTKPVIVENLIDIDLLKQNNQFNKANFEKTDYLSISHMIIQDYTIANYGKPSSFENEFLILDEIRSYTISLEQLTPILQKIRGLRIDDDLVNRLFEASLAPFSVSIKSRMMKSNTVNYKNMLAYIVGFKVELRKLEPKKDLPVIKNEAKPVVAPKKTEESKQQNNGKPFGLSKLIQDAKKDPEAKVDIEESKKPDNKREPLPKLAETNNKARGDRKPEFYKRVLDNKNKDNVEKFLNDMFVGQVDKVKPAENEEQAKKFDSFIDKVKNLEYKGYDYKLTPNDYFKRPDGTAVETILLNEDAAIKKCEELSSKLKPVEDFVDKDFGSNPQDPNKNKTSLYMNGTCPKGGIEASMIEWYKMDKIAETPVFLDESADCNDVIQGALGDCWFISALSVIATKPHLLRGEFSPEILEDGEIDNEEGIMLSTGIFPPIFHGFRKQKIFCFKFYKNFEWVYVIVDDRFPCKKIFNDRQVPKLLYGRCKNENEFWVPLIEKAYAKLHGSYEALISGFIDDGLVDLTGLVARKMVINEELKTPENVDALWKEIKKYCSKDFELASKTDKKGKALKSVRLTKNNTMMGCSVDAQGAIESEVVFNNHKSGVLAGHAYSILDVFEVAKPESLKKRKASRLLRVRNPWGFKEWSGKWCDQSEELTRNADK